MNLKSYPWQLKHWQRMKRLQRDERLPHALLFTGPEGVGIGQFISAFSASILCDENEDGQACGHCRACMLFQSNNHPDMLWMEPEEEGKQIKVEQVRELIDFMHLSSQYAKYKIAVIAPADAMNRNAANALLKTLEEPPPGVVIGLLTNYPDRLPVTIRSRCQRFNFPEVAPEVAQDWLVSVMGMAPDDAAELLELSPGQPLLALELSEGDTLQSQRQVLADLADLARSRADIISIAGRWHDYGAEQVFRWIMGFMRLCTHLKLQCLDNTPSNQANNPDLHRIANELNLQQLISGYDMAMNQHRAVNAAFNLNRSGLLEDFIIHWQSMNNVEEGNR